MAAVVVVFHSASGTTEKLADSVMSGAASLPGVAALKVEILGSDIVEERYQNKESPERGRCGKALPISF